MKASRSGLSICMLSGFLLLCLACLEIPEMSTLTDDVSNDFAILTIPGQTPAVVMHVNAFEIRRHATAHVIFQHAPAFIACVEPIVQQNPPDLLALHSFRRT